MLRSLLFFCTVLFPILLLAQAPQVGALVENEFKTTAVPEKWKGESAVIMAQKTEYLFTRLALTKTQAVVRIKEYIHKRIKLQDKNSLEKFSTFFYVTMGKDGSAEYKIIKADGKENDVDMKTAIEEENDVPAIYRPILFRMNFKKMKIAIPNLEVGDIIDYTVRSTIDWDLRENGIEFTPFIFSLANSYPTMYQQYKFIMANGMKVKYRAFNGAPNIRFDPKASVYGDKNSYLGYYFMDKEREKSNEERWNYEFRNMPTVKFRVVLLADNDTESKGLGEATIDRSGLDINDVYRRFAGAGVYQTPTVNTLVGYTTEYIAKKKTEGALKTDDDLIRETYYCLRKVFLEMYYKGAVQSELAKSMTGKKLYKKIQSSEKKAAKEEREDEIRINSITFATALRTALANVGVASELFVYMPRRLGKWSDAIFMEELDFMLRVKYKRKFLYLDAFNNFDALGSFYPYMENVEGYAIGYQEVNQYFRGTVPASVYTDNVEKQDYQIALSDAMDVMKVERLTSLLGAEKLNKVEPANLTRDYLAYDFEKYYYEGKQKSGKAQTVAMETSARYENPDKEEKERERKELFEKMVKGEFELDKYDAFELVKDGRYGDTSWLQYKERFTLKKLINKAGRNYVLEIGKLIGDQIKLEPSEIASRQTDIWIANARTLENNIVFSLPAGYTVEGVQDLNTSVENESGSFVTTAKVEDNKLYITARKIYKKSFDRKEAWPSYVAFLEPAYKFSQAKVVLKKK